ncbi:hypothetical protein FRC06_011457 [Ceratobasidium sp. 370]|nr:hypothetical protein FRC06_011457 [Ceratobasidium sp. 370]
MAIRIWNDTTDGEAWLVEPTRVAGDSESDYITSSDTDSTADTASTIQSADIHSKFSYAPAFFRIEYGRAFPAYEGIPMVLPADDEEIRRLRIQHLAIKRVAGETLDEVISAHLSSDSGERRKRVLDVRTQTGMWAEETAVKFPGVGIISIDVVPTIPHQPRANLQYEVYDIHEGIIEADETFDIVHARHSIGMVMDWRSLLKDMHRVLRPGGLFVFEEIYPQLTLPEERVPALEGPASRSARLFEDLRSILSKRGVLLEESRDIDAWLNPGNELWGSQPASGFHSIIHRVWEMPINGFWHPDPAMEEVGILMGLNVCQFVESTRPVFLSAGLTGSEYDKWANDIRREVQDPMNNAVIRYHLVCAYKP